VGRGDVTRFDFLHDGLPDVVESALSLRLPRRLRSVAAAFATLVLTLIAAGAFEAIRANDASAVERAEQARFDAAKNRLAAADLELREVARLVETDRRLHELRTSGERAVARLARIGNEVPRGAWLSSIEPSAQGLSVEGEALDVGALDRALSNLVAETDLGGTRLLRMERVVRVAGTPLVSFRLQVQGLR
jgi:hypothetical protein